MTHFFKGFLLIACVTALVACATNKVEENQLTPEQIAEEAGYEIIEPVKRILNYRIDGWNYIAVNALKISAGVRDDYLIILLHSCHGLRSVDVIGTTSTGNSLSKFESVVVEDMAFGQEQCPIDSLYKIKKIPH